MQNDMIQSPFYESLLSGKKWKRHYNFDRKSIELEWQQKEQVDCDEGISDTTQYHSKDLLLAQEEKYISHVEISEDEDSIEER